MKRLPAYLLLCLLPATFAGCAESGTSAPDASVPDGAQTDGQYRPDVDVSVPWHIGSADTFEIATWNIRNFPSDYETPRLVAELILQTDFDLIAVEEIADESAFDELMSMLPGYDSLLSPHEYGSGEYQKTGFVFRRDMLRIREWSLLFVSESYTFPRPPLEAEFYLQSPSGEQSTLWAIVVHLKAEGGETNERRRRTACERLSAYIEQRTAQGLGPYVLLGDFNDRLDDPPSDNVFASFTSHPDEFRFTTEPLAGRLYSFVPARSLIDHLVFSSGWFPRLENSQTQIPALDRQVEDYDYVDRVSDHLPVATIMQWQ